MSLGLLVTARDCIGESGVPWVFLQIKIKFMELKIIFEWKFIHCKNLIYVRIYFLSFASVFVLGIPILYHKLIN